MIRILPLFALCTVILIGCHSFVKERSEHLDFGKPSKSHQILYRDAFVIGYNYKTKVADWVSAKVTRKSVKGYRKRDVTFKEEKQVPIMYRAKLASYVGSGFDRGHLMPNATADYNKKSQEESFVLSNIAPQHPQLNREGWRALENNVRKMAKKYEVVYVVTGTIYDKEREYIKGRVEIPDKFFKVMYIPSIKKMTAYVMPNAPVSKYNIDKYIVSVDEVEKMTGMDFFCKLPDSEEREMEKEINDLSH